MEAEEGSPPLLNSAQRAKVAVETLNESTSDVVTRDALTGVLKSHIGVLLDATCPVGSIAKLMKDKGKCLVIEVCDMEAMERDNRHVGRSRVAGPMGGLASENLPYMKRIYVIVDSPSGVYAVKKLHVRFHYQVRILDIDEFLSDVSGLGFNICVAGLGDCSGKRHGSSEVLRIEAPSVGGKPDCIVITPSTGHVMCFDRNPVTGTPEESLFCVGGDGMKHYDAEVSKLRPEEFVDFLHGQGKSCNPSAMKRNQDMAINFGFSAQNTTDKSQERFHFMPSTPVPTSHDGAPGLNGTGSLGEDLRDLMLHHSELLRKVEIIFGLQLFQDTVRNSHFAGRIREGNIFEMITLGISLTLLGCHVDDLNSRKPGFDWNFTVYKYKSVGDDWVRMHIGGYGRRICECLMDRNVNLDRLVEHLVAYIARLPRSLVVYSPEAVLGEQEMDRPSPRYSGERFRDMHLNKLVYYQFFVKWIATWLQERRKIDYPVTLPEGLHIVLSFFRWTTSASQARVSIQFVLNKIIKLISESKEDKVRINYHCHNSMI